nr:LysM peptidoglycan-binding domain-containing protein [Ardenticatenia bacterium]
MTRGVITSSLVALILLAAFAAVPVHAEGTGTYTVQPGDTLVGVAARLGVSLSQLAAANGLRWNSWVYVGQRLVIPGSLQTPT